MPPGPYSSPLKPSIHLDSLYFTFSCPRDLIKLIRCHQVVRNKAYVEFKGAATQNNGKPYNNFYLWVLVFDDEGHVVEVREYLDTGLVRQVMSDN